MSKPVSADPALSPLSVAAPRPAQAIITVLAYFGLQLALSLPLYPILAWLRRTPWLTGGVRQNADLLLWATTLDLLLAGLVMLYVIHRHWPQAWPRGDGQGLGWAPARRRDWLLGVMLGLLLVPWLSSGLTEWLAHGATITEQIDILITQAGPAARLPLLLLTVTLVPVVEETLFRGVLLSALRSRYSVTVAVALSSLAFAVAHLGSFAYQWYALPALGLFALLLATLRLYSRSIWPGVAAHACNNLVALIAILHR